MKKPEAIVRRAGCGHLVCGACQRGWSCQMCERPEAIARHLVSHADHEPLLVCDECVALMTRTAEGAGA